MVEQRNCRWFGNRGNTKFTDSKTCRVIAGNIYRGNSSWNIIYKERKAAGTAISVNLLRYIWKKTR